MHINKERAEIPNTSRGIALLILYSSNVFCYEFRMILTMKNDHPFIGVQAQRKEIQNLSSTKFSLLSKFNS